MADTNTSIDEVLGEDAVTAESDTSRAKSARRKLFLLFLIVFLVIGAATGAGFVLFVEKDTTLAAEDEAPVIEAPRETAYIDLKPIFIQIETGRGIIQNVVVSLSLEVEKGSDHQRQVQRALPRLRTARRFAKRFHEALWEGESAAEAARVARAALAASDQFADPFYHALIRVVGLGNEPVFER